MSKAFDKIMAGLQETLAYAKGEKTGAKLHAPAIDKIDVRALRERLGVSQSEFATIFGTPIGTVKGWEQGRREPEGPAKALLMVIDHSPGVVLAALHAKSGVVKDVIGELGDEMVLVRKVRGAWKTVEKHPRNAVIAEHELKKLGAKGRSPAKRKQRAS